MIRLALALVGVIALVALAVFVLLALWLTLPGTP